MPAKILTFQMPKVSHTSLDLQPLEKFAPTLPPVLPYFILFSFSSYTFLPNSPLYPLTFMYTRSMLLFSPFYSLWHQLSSTLAHSLIPPLSPEHSLLLLLTCSRQTTAISLCHSGSRLRTEAESRTVRPDWAILRVLRNEFSHKSGPNIKWLFGLWKTSLYD